MRLRICFCVFFTVSVFQLYAQVDSSQAEDKRTQYPKFLRNSYYNLSLGYIDYHFTNSLPETGFTAESIETPHLAMRLVFFGYRINKYLSAQVSYMKPPIYVKYKNINGDQGIHSVW